MTGAGCSPIITSSPGVTELITMGSRASRSPAERRPWQAQSQNSLKNPGNLGRNPEMRPQLQILIPSYLDFSFQRGMLPCAAKWGSVACSLNLSARASSKSLPSGTSALVQREPPVLQAVDSAHWLSRALNSWPQVPRLPCSRACVGGRLSPPQPDPGVLVCPSASWSSWL